MNIDEILTQVLYGKTTKCLKENEKKLDQIASNNYGELLLVLANFLSNEEVEINKRKLSATILKNMISKFDPHKEKWITLNPEIKESIKLNILSTLASQSKDIVNASSDTIAGICRIDTPRGEWLEIYDILYKTSLDENPKVRISSILTMGYISEEVNPIYLDAIHKNNFLFALISNLDPTDSELINTTLDAFIKFCPMIRSNMEAPKEREIIMNRLYEIIDYEDIFNNKGIVLLEQIAKYYYDFLKDNIDRFIEITKRNFYSKQDDVVAGTFELWITISCEEATRRKKNKEFFLFCNKALPVLKEAMKHYLLNRNRLKEKEDKDRWTNAKYSGILISYLSECADHTIIDFVFDLIRDYLGNEDSKIRESVILAFGSILQTIHYARIKDIIEGALPILIDLLTDKNIDVRSTVAWSLRKITQYHTDCLINMSNTNPNLLDTFLENIIKNINSNKRVVLQLVDCFSNIIINTKEYLEEAHPGAVLQTSILSKFYPDILNSLIQIAYKKDAYEAENNIAMASLFSINSLVDFSPLDCSDFIKEYFNNIVTALVNTTANELFKDNIEKKYNYQENLCAIINSYFIGDKINLNEEQCVYLYNVVEKIFKERNSVFQSGILSCSKLIVFTFNNYTQNFEQLFSNYCQYLFMAICQWEDSDICSVAIGVVSDFIRNIHDPFEKYLNEMFEKIYSIGRDSQSNKMLKIRVLNVFSDLFLMDSPIAKKNFYNIMCLLNEACQASTTVIHKEDDEELYNYYEELRVTILESFSSFIVTSKEKEGKSKIEKFKSGIVNYLNKIVQELSPTNEEILSTSLGIYTELYELYTDESEIDLNIIERLILILNSKNPQEYKDLIEWSKYVFHSYNA